MVDEESLVRWSLAETLRAAGCAVTEAADGESAIRTLSSHADGIDAVLLDLCMPDSSGLRTLKTLRQRSPAIPVVLMAADGTPELQEEALRLGAFAVINKPFDVNAVPELIERALAARPD